MFKKKHSEINIQVQNNTYSPFRKNSHYSPFTRTPERSNLSPMKNVQKKQGYSAKSPRKQFTCEVYSTNKQILNKDVNFESQLQCLGNTIFEGHSSISQKNTAKGGTKTFCQIDASPFSNISNYQTSQRNMKQSKKVFSNVISKMNSNQKKTDNASNQNSVFEECHQLGMQSQYAQPQSLPIASFKALKQIKMIESVQPLAPPPLLQKSSSHKGNVNGPTFSQKKNTIKQSKIFPQQANINEFKCEQKSKKQRIVQLINQSFSIQAPMDRVFQQIEVKDIQLFNGKAGKIFESMQIDQSIDFKGLNTLLTKLDEKDSSAPHKNQLQIHSVKVSMESAKNSLTMDPFL